MEFLTRVPLARPKRNVDCILFTATAALIVAMLAAGIPVRHHPLRTDQFVAPLSSIGHSKFWELLQDQRFQYLAIVTFFVSPTNSLQTYNTPSNWNNAANTIGMIAGGGSGASTSGLGGGGGAGAYSAASNITLGATAFYLIGAGGSGIGGGSGNDGGMSQIQTGHHY